MIDIENQIFSEVAKSLRETFDGIAVMSEYVKAPSKFPCVTIVEMDNNTNPKYQTSSLMETHADIVYEVNGYSNKKSGKKKECKEMMALIDQQFQKMGFTRIMMNPIQNLEDSTIYRIIARYKAVVSEHNIIYRR